VEILNFETNYNGARNYLISDYLWPTGVSGARKMWVSLMMERLRL